MINYKKLISVESMALVEMDSIQRNNAIKELTITSTGEDRFTLKLYREHSQKNLLYIPRALIKEIPIEKDFNNIEHVFKSQIKLRDNQIQPIEDYLSAIREISPYGGIIKAPTGSGKTLMAIEIAMRLRLKTLIIVPLSGLMNQWKEMITKFTNIKSKDIGHIQQSICNYKNKPITLSMIHSLVSRQDKYPKEIYNNFGLVIYDEAHKVGCETFSRTASMFNCKYRLGLSATPRRKDGMEKVFQYHIGQIVGQSNIQKIKPRIIMIPYNGYDANHRNCIWHGKLSLGAYYNRLMSLEKRTELICDYVEGAYSKDRKILVLTERLEHIDNMHKDLTTRLRISDGDIGIYTAKIKQSDRRITLATYGSFGMGIDVASLDTLIYAQPRVDIEQSVGRITREYKDKKQPVVIDIVDTASSIMVNWSKARLKTYRKIAEEIIQKN